MDVLTHVLTPSQVAVASGHTGLTAELWFMVIISQNRHRTGHSVGRAKPPGTQAADGQCSWPTVPMGPVKMGYKRGAGGHLDKLKEGPPQPRHPGMGVPLVTWSNRSEGTRVGE